MKNGQGMDSISNNRAQTRDGRDNTETQQQQGEGRLVVSTQGRGDDETATMMNGETRAIVATRGPG